VAEFNLLAYGVLVPADSDSGYSVLGNGFRFIVALMMAVSPPLMSAGLR
jgi:hypothetical protein